MVGHFSKTMQESVRFAPLIDELLVGHKPENLDQIVISTGLAKKLLGDTNVLNKTLYVSYNDTEMLLDSGALKRSFVNTQIKVTGLIDSNKYEVYHESYWTINFFKSRLGVSAFDLSISSIAFSSKDTSDCTIKDNKDCTIGANANIVICLRKGLLGNF